MRTSIVLQNKRQFLVFIVMIGAMSFGERSSADEQVRYAGHGTIGNSIGAEPGPWYSNPGGAQKVCSELISMFQEARPDVIICWNKSGHVEYPYGGQCNVIRER